MNQMNRSTPCIAEEMLLKKYLFVQLQNKEVFLAAAVVINDQLIEDVMWWQR